MIDSLPQKEGRTLFSFVLIYCKYSLLFLNLPIWKKKKQSTEPVSAEISQTRKG